MAEAFHKIGVATGGDSVRAHYHANYYAAFMLDPDGNNLEGSASRPGQALGGGRENRL